MIGGIKGFSTDANALASNGKGLGTIPHALIAAYNGDTLAATSAFDKYVAPDIARIALVDFRHIIYILQPAQYQFADLVRRYLPPELVLQFLYNILNHFFKVLDLYRTFHRSSRKPGRFEYVLSVRCARFICCGRIFAL